MDEKNMNTIANSEEAANQVQHPDYAQEIVRIIRSNRTPMTMKTEILGYHENDIAAALELLNKDERARLYNILDTETLANTLEYTKDFGQYFSELNIRKKIDILSHAETDTVVDYLKELSKKERAMLIDLMDDETKREIVLLSSFDEDEIGSRMTTNYVVIKQGLTVREAMRSLIEQAAENDNISTLYVVDDQQLFYGAIDLKDLIIARNQNGLEDIITSSYPYVYAHEQIEDCIDRIRDYSEDSIPVLDDNNKLLGALTSQEMVDIVDDELGEDYAKFAGLVAEEELNEPVRRSMSKRLPWLVILLGLGLVVSSVVGLFEAVVAELTLIVSFQSLILDMAGNVGTQSLAVTIRVLTDEELTAKQKFLLIIKEARLGLLNGLVLGSASLVLIGLFIHFAKGMSWHIAFLLSSCTGVALLVSMFLASITGTCIPLIFNKLKIDPAVASGPLITTLNDLVAVITYYGLAWVLLINVMHM